MNNICSDKSYIFKINLVSGVWRKIQIPSDFSLGILHSTIIEAFNFEDDHLYAFFMDNILWSEEKAFWSPYAESSPSADAVKLSSFHFKKRDSFLYLFDFGDEWVFDVSFIEEVIDESQEVLILESHGKSPEQYPDYEEF